MPCVPLLNATGKKVVGTLTFAGYHKPGDPPPAGYNDWHEWAKVQAKAGLKQERCGRCSKYKFPQEFSRRESQTYTAYRTKRDALREVNPIEVHDEVPICLDCDGK